jgi:threonine dehydratase
MESTSPSNTLRFAAVDGGTAAHEAAVVWRSLSKHIAVEAGGGGLASGRSCTT